MGRRLQTGKSSIADGHGALCAAAFNYRRPFPAGVALETISVRNGLLAVIVVASVVFTVLWVRNVRRTRVAGSTERIRPTRIELAIGAVTNFFDTLRGQTPAQIHSSSSPPLLSSHVRPTTRFACCRELGVDA